MSSNLYDRTVRELMSKDVVNIHFHETVHDALQLMVENRLAALPVIDGHRHCVGMISTADLIDLTLEVDDELNDASKGPASPQWLLDQFAEGLGHQKIEELMTENVTNIGPDAPLLEATSLMVKHHIHHLPVVDDEGKLLGILSTIDILRAVEQSAPK
ncbi:MAG: CBS domain-containing protein [Pirellulaceae bacterium]